MTGKSRSFVRLLASALLSAICIPASAFAWGELGHATVGQIAEQNLTPRAKRFAFDILGGETFAYAANFADSVRSDPRYDAFKEYHFVTLEPGKTYSQSTHPDRDMDVMMKLAIEKLPRPEISHAEKVLLLRYLIHVVGDAHQPFHAGKSGEVGGNVCNVYIQDPYSGSKVMENIHHVWDDYLTSLERERLPDPNGRTTGWFGYAEYTRRLTALPEAAALRRKADKEGSATETLRAKWIDDTYRLGQDAYPVVKGSKNGYHPYCRYSYSAPAGVPRYSAASIPTLAEPYIAKHLPIVRTQILLAGYRLANIMDQLAEKSGTKPAKDVDTIESLLKALETLTN